MTTRELNHAIKKLNQSIKDQSPTVKAQQLDDYYKWVENVAKPEFMRLMNADNSFRSLSKESILIMLRLNLRHRFVSFHNFGLHIEI